MTEEELIKKVSTESIEVVFKSVNADRQIVYGEVYTPNVLDTYGEMMLPEDVETLAHRFLATLKNDQIDLQHNNRTVRAVAIESFIARKGDPDYNEGAWVLGLYVADQELWDDIKAGKYNGYSVEMLVTKEEALVEYSFTPHVFGVTEKSDGHVHYYFLQLDDAGDIVGGVTSEEDGHSHSVIYGTATEKAGDHSHRYVLS